ncbi:MAG TPA: tyrosine-type recombinase/integrase [Thermoleophilaceae bacterium]|nr:tyrosine-type recombinase/integrase [Thermoleophilaceae bacterium]
METTTEKGIFRAHRADCDATGKERCGCPYTVVWRHRKKQHKKTFRTFKEAKEGRGQRLAGESRPTSRDRFEDYARGWIVSYRGRTKRGKISDRTRAMYKRDMERWAIPYFERFQLAEVEPPDVRAFVGHLEAKGLSPSTVRSIVAPLRAMFATAVEDGALRANPAREVRIAGKSATDDEPARAMTRDELQRLLAEVPDEWRPFFELLAQTGLRISEALGLQWGDVQFGDRPMLQVRRQDCRGELGPLKTANSRRDIPLSPTMSRRLWRQRRGKAETARIFTTKTGTPLSDRNVYQRVLQPAAKRAGVPWVTFHTFRHTCASLLFAGGEDGENRKDINQVSKWLGHYKASFTLDTYVHLMDDQLGGADFLDTLTAPQGNTGATQGIQSDADDPPAETQKAAS